MLTLAESWSWQEVRVNAGGDRESAAAIGVGAVAAVRESGVTGVTVAATAPCTSAAPKMAVRALVAPAASVPAPTETAPPVPPMATAPPDNNPITSSTKTVG
jgi:hypothetical protein